MEEDANGLFKIPKSNDTRRLPVGRCETVGEQSCQQSVSRVL